MKTTENRTAQNIARDKQYASFDFRLFRASRIVKQPCECGYDRINPKTRHCPWCGRDR